VFNPSFLGTIFWWC